MGHDRIFDHMMLDGLEDAYEGGRAMGISAKRRRKPINSAAPTRTLMPSSR